MPLSFTVPDRFSSADEEAWWASVDKALKGQSRQRLFETTEDAFENAPLYGGRTDVPPRALRPAGQEWSLVQSVDLPDPVEANVQILEDLEGGAAGVELVFSSPENAASFGIRVNEVADIEALLKDVQPELIDLRLNTGGRHAELAALVLAYLDKAGVDPTKVKLTLDLDPCGWSAQQGAGGGEIETFRAECRDVVEALRAAGSPAQVLLANGRVWHDAGATPAQELAYVLATAADYLRLLETTSLPAEAWAERISVVLVADADQIGTIAKARALRALWSCLLEGADLPQVRVHLNMSTSYRMLTQRDPWVNLLRNTVAAFAAGIGGADSITVLPHTRAIGLPDAFARRLARNTQSILLEESSLSKVADPSAGSGAIEERTDNLCAAAWALFQEIEADGGLTAAIETGKVRAAIEKASTEREQRIAKRKTPITGVSEFPLLAEDDVSVLEAPVDGLVSTPDVSPDLPGAGNGERFSALCERAAKGGKLLTLSTAQDRRVLKPARVAQSYERLRLVADAFNRKSDQPARIFLASLGNLAQFTARATWTANAFAAGGIGAVGPTVYETIDEMVDDYRASGCSIACIVSADAVYADQAEDAARALKAAGARHLYLAGRPGDREEAYAAAGVDTYLFAGCDLLALLEQAHGVLQKSQGIEISEQEVLR